MANEIICPRCEHAYFQDEAFPCPRCKFVPANEDERRRIEVAVRARMIGVEEDFVVAAIKMAIALYETNADPNKKLEELLQVYVEKVATMKRVR